MSLVATISRSSTGCLLDDLFGVCRERDRTNVEAAVPLAMHVVGKPVVDGESFHMTTCCRCQIPCQSKGDGAEDHSGLDD
jgi:hypothetical protein